MKAFGGSLLLLALLALGGVCSPTANGCATARQKGERVRIAGETALIIWDEKTKTEHFIRRASFQTQVPYFGFLVPTPTKPTLAEAPDEVFQRMEDWTKPEEKTKWVAEPLIPIGCPGSADKGDKDKSGVEVLGRQRVAGFDAVILKATDGGKLREWLEQHGYDARPQLTEWLEPYLEKGWIVTAFQIAKSDKKEDSLPTQAVRMSFKADRPFFPYREPSDADQDNGKRRRLLRVFLVAGQRMQGTLEEEKQPWQGRAVWANPLTGEQRDALADQAGKQVRLSEGAWLTVFEDASSVRPGADLIFEPSADQTTLKRPPIIQYKTYPVPAPGEVCCLLAFGGPLAVLLLIRRWKRRRAA
jgi:hypothetical protein